MSFCSFAEGAGMYDVTPIENMFLLEYLPTAPGKFLRVYLYARMACLHPELCASMEDMAKSLHMTEEEIYDAMTYWERQGLVVRMSDRPPTYAVVPMHGSMNVNPMENDYYQYRDFNATLQSYFGENPLHPRQYEIAYDWLNLLGFTQEAVYRMVEGRLKKHRGRKVDTHKFFENLNKTASDWSKRGVKTAEDVEKALMYDGQIEKTTAAVMNRLAMNRPASVDEMKMVARWLNEWKFTHEEILDACVETTKSRAPSLSYLEGILKNRMQGSGDRHDMLKNVLNELGLSFPGKIPANLTEGYEKLLERGFEPETVRLAAVQCSRKNKNRFEDLTWMLDEWGKAGLFRRDEAEAYLQRMQLMKEEISAILAITGTRRNPNMSDIAFYEKWQENSTPELITYAAECAKGMPMPIRYIDKLITEWQKSGVKTLDDARAQHEARKAAQPAGAPAANPALNYEQHDKGETNYGSLFIDLDNYGKGGDEA